MQQFFNNRYVQITALTISLAIVFFLVLWLTFNLVGLGDFPIALELVLAVLGAGVLVYKFFASRIS